MSPPQMKKFMHYLKKNFLNELYLCCNCADAIIRRCVTEAEMLSVLEMCHLSPIGVHNYGVGIVHKNF